MHQACLRTYESPRPRRRSRPSLPRETTASSASTAGPTLRGLDFDPKGISKPSWINGLDIIGKRSSGDRVCAPLYRMVDSRVGRQGDPPHRRTRENADMAVPTRYILHQGPVIGAIARAAVVAMKSALSGKRTNPPFPSPRPGGLRIHPAAATRPRPRLHPARRWRSRVVPGPGACASVSAVGISAASPGGLEGLAVPATARAQRRQPPADELRRSRSTSVSSSKSSSSTSTTTADAPSFISARRWRPPRIPKRSSPTSTASSRSAAATSRRRSKDDRARVPDMTSKELGRWRLGTRRRVSISRSSPATSIRFIGFRPPLAARRVSATSSITDSPRWRARSKA